MEHDYIAKIEELSEDVDACLPSPINYENSERSDDTNSYVEEQSVKVERKENEELEVKNKIPINEKAYLTHEEALINVLEKGLVPKDFLNTWSNEDLTGVLVQLAKNSTDEDGVKQIARHFKDTSNEEIMDCINQCKTINKIAEKERFRLEEMSKPEIEITNQIPNIYPNWVSLIERIKRLRGIGDQSANVISSYLNECSEEAGTSQRGSPNYKRIYECLARMVKGYSMKNARLLDEAVILDIFEEIEREIDARPDITRFFRKTFRDAQYLTETDFKLDELDENNLANILNILNFPTEKIKFVP